MAYIGLSKVACSGRGTNCSRHSNIQVRSFLKFTMASNFSSVPVLDFKLSQSPMTKPKFLEDLLYAVSHVGFLYLANPPVPALANLLPYVPKIFDLPQDAKDKIDMANSPHFFGYSKLGKELTKGQIDQREQFDFGTPFVCRWKEGDPDYYKAWGPSQYPDEALLPGFKIALEKYFLQVTDLGYQFVDLLEEAFHLTPGTLRSFFDRPEYMMHQGKLVKYPDDVSTDRGISPHYDAGFLTFLLQASPHRGLQVQNLAGQWIDVPPIENTFVINIGRALEFITQGLARATSHRVVSPPKGSGPRYSIPFFQNIGMNIKLTEKIIHFPPEIESLRATRGSVSKTDAINYAEYDKAPAGLVAVIGRVKSHPDVAQKYYPALFKEMFPNGWKEGMKGSAY